MGIPLRTAVFWKAYNALDRAPVFQQSPQNVRKASDRRVKMLRLPGASLIAGRRHPGVQVTEETARLADGTALPLRVYRPTGTAADKPAVVLNFHGGGWVSGDVHQSDWWASSVAAEAGVVVISVEYRLAPEHPFPVPAEDCYQATVWVAEHADELGVDGGRLAVMGDSAGGNLAAVVSIMARDRGGPPIALQVLIYPSVDLGAEYPSKHENAKAPILGREDLEHTWKLYLHGTDADPKDPYASPLFASHRDLPPALIQTAQHDPLRDQGPAYAEALRKEGVPVRLTNYVSAVHGYISLPRVVPAAHQALAEVVAELKDALNR